MLSYDRMIATLEHYETLFDGFNRSCRELGCLENGAYVMSLFEGIFAFGHEMEKYDHIKGSMAAVNWYLDHGDRESAHYEMSDAVQQVWKVKNGES